MLAQNSASPSGPFIRRTGEADVIASFPLCLTCPSVQVPTQCPYMAYLIHVSPLSSPAKRGWYPPSCSQRGRAPCAWPFLRAFAPTALASWIILFPHGTSAFVTSGLPADKPDPYGVSVFHCP